MNEISKVETLFRPFKLKNITLRNRIVMAPMTRSKSPDGVPTQNVADYYAARAAPKEAQVSARSVVVSSMRVRQPVTRIDL